MNIVLMVLFSIICYLSFSIVIINGLAKRFICNQKFTFLSFPFILSYWIVSLAVSNFSNINLDENHIYTINEAVKNQSSLFYQFIHSMDSINISPLIISYFKTLSGTFFQSSVLAGILISMGLLYFSRIAFSLSVIGFYLAYFFYSIFGADVNDLNYNLMGANFIFLAIAMGCFLLFLIYIVILLLWCLFRF